MAGGNSERYDRSVKCWPYQSSVLKGAVFLIGCLSAVAALGQTNPAVIWSARVHDQGLASMAVSPDGTMVATGAGDRTIKFLRVSDGAVSRTIPVPENFVSVAFSPDGTLLASCGSSSLQAWLRLWRVSDGTLLRSILTVSDMSGNRLPLAFSPDAGLVAAVVNRTNVGMWQVSDGTLARVLRGSKGGSINSIAFSPDGARVAVASGIRGFDVGVHVVRVADGTLERSVVPDNDYGVAQATFSPDSTLLAMRPFSYSSFKGNVEIYRVSDGGLSRTFMMKGDAVAFSLDGAALVTTWYDTIRGRAVVEFWRVSDWTLVAAYDDLPWLGGRFGPVAFVPAGDRVVLGGNVTMTIDMNTTSRGTLTMIRAPVFFTGTTAIAGGSGEIRWTGGPGPYQVQVRRDWSSPWSNLGTPVNGNSAVVPATGPETYYRLVVPDGF
jgi:WD40 repeat protein